MPAVAQMLLVASWSGLIETLYDRTLGTNIGDMAAGGGLNAAFDGNANQIHTAGSKKDNTTAAFIGKTLAAPHPISKIIVTPSSNFGFWSSAANTAVSIYAKPGVAPANATDGTLLGTTGSFVDGTAAKTIISSDNTTPYAHVWAAVTGGDPSDSACVAEVEIYVMA